jgi:subtilisin family serine protease
VEVKLLRTRIFLCIVCLSLLFTGKASDAFAAPVAQINWADPAIIPGELVVVMEPGSRATALRVPEGAAVQRTSHALNMLNAIVMRVPEGREQEFAGAFQNMPGVLAAEPNYVVTADLVPNDALWTQQYGPAHIQAPAAWDLTTGSASVIVAVIDSGIDSGHPEFAGRLVPGYDFVEDDALPQDNCGHGTHVAGIIAAAGNNAEGIAGMAWNARIMPVRVLNQFCSGSTSDVAEAMVWAVEHGATVINLSLGSSTPSTLMENGSFYAYTHGAAIFAAAGNSGSTSVAYPAAYAWVTAVGATDQNDLRASYSNTGAALDLMAPGSSILSTTPLGGFYYHDLLGIPSEYGTLSGTSMAAAHASGAAALLASRPGYDTPDKIYQALTSTARNLDVPGRDNNTGYGLIQVYDALNFTPVIVPTPTPGLPLTSYDVQDSLKCGNLVTYHWRDAAAGGPANWLPVFGNNGYATMPLPFPFTFGDVIYNNVTVSANGYLTFGGTGGATENFIIPAIAQPNNFIAPFWDDLNPSAGGLMYQATFGAAPNREYVVEWNEVPISGLVGSALTFEVVLSEGSNNILFQYHTLTGSRSDGSFATIGVEYADGTAGREYSYNKAGAVQAGQAIRFAPYPTGGTPPSNACSAFTRPVDENGGFFDAPPFCVEIPAGALKHPATLQIQLLNSAPPIPSELVNLHHYADITLSYSPAPPLSLLPEVYVCYHYTAADVLLAGGHPENLRLAAYGSADGAWEVLPTTANTASGLITARATHLSIYGVVTYAAPSDLPVTGAPISEGAILAAAALLAILAMGAGWGLARRRRTA